MLELRSESPPEWIAAVLADFDGFLVDHAACERKASATAMSFVVRYPDRELLIEPMIELAIEELEHFHQVYKIISERRIKLTPDVKDPYINTLLKAIRTGRDERLLDRLVVGGVVEARGCERFRIVADALPEGDLKVFYDEIAKSEARHHGLFLRMARHYFPEDVVAKRHDEFLGIEAVALAGLKPRAVLH